jgi:hypothetical protein
MRPFTPHPLIRSIFILAIAVIVVVVDTEFFAPNAGDLLEPLLVNLGGAVFAFWKIVNWIFSKIHRDFRLHKYQYYFCFIASLKSI